jgi:ABC-type sugar transport system ATPase subunit
VARRRATGGAAAIYATNDAAEALATADRVAVLHSVALAQAGPPGVVGEIRVRGPHADYHGRPPAGPLLIREAGPPGPAQARSADRCCGPG